MSKLADNSKCAIHVSRRQSRSSLRPRVNQKLAWEYSVRPNVSNFAFTRGAKHIENCVILRPSATRQRSGLNVRGEHSDMDDKEACSSSSKDTERLASIAGAFLSDNITTLSKPFHELFHRKTGSVRQSPALPPLRHSLADAAALPSYVDLQSRLRSSVATEERQKLLKHRLKPQVTFTSGVLHSSQR